MEPHGGRRCARRRPTVNFTENQAQLRNIVVKSDAMQLSGDARINVQTSEFGFDLKGTEVKIGKSARGARGKDPRQRAGDV